ncbi:guanine nucleotide-binding protein subunit beta-like protein 1 isoform X2 [Actinia tenebrosa]|uniref:Guanine nucleotide-binding protein subunit beta-like protein 1 isoform X2 n=1 Tax=Actinia tenebrosa TaxID=6105 RepID=A0A6P8HAC8_ACTTE|nr:guanine nucleotide-binding protein subunit beta-like protein 1 isoform X2 [Actinia tenebrosa]
MSLSLLLSVFVMVDFSQLDPPKVLSVSGTSKPKGHGRDGFINSWDLSEGGLSHTTKLACPVFGFCKFSILQKDDKLWLATASEQQSQIDIINLDSKECIHTIKCEENMTYGMCMCVKLFLCPSTHQPKVLAGYEDGFLRLWDVGSSKVESQLKVHSESVMCMDFDEKLLKVVTGSADDKLVVSNLLSQNTLTIHKSIELKKPGVASVKIRDDSKLLSVGCWDGRIRIYSWKTLKPLAVLNYHSETVNSLDFSAHLPDNGILMAAGSKDCRISLWSLYNDS